MQNNGSRVLWKGQRPIPVNNVLPGFASQAKELIKRRKIGKTQGSIWFCRIVCLSVLAGIAAISGGPLPLMAQNGAKVKIFGVDYSVFGHYKALARLCLESFEEGHAQEAGMYAHIIERAWDHSEHDFEKKSPKQHQEIDMAMDRFIDPIKDWAAKGGGPRPELDAVRNAYAKYIEKLDASDSWFDAEGNFLIGGDHWPHPDNN